MPLTNLEPTDLFPAVETKLDAAIDALNELQGGTADQIYKKTNSTDFNFEASNSILPASGTGNLKIKIIEIGDWDMQSTSSVNVAHGLTLANIRTIDAMIIKDDSSLYSSLYNDDDTSSIEVKVSANATNIVLKRVGAGTFDNPIYNSTSFNRGFITIIYEG